MRKSDLYKVLHGSLNPEWMVTLQTQTLSLWCFQSSDRLWGWTLKINSLGQRQSSEDFNIQPVKLSLQINTRIRRHNSLFVFQPWYNWPKLLRLLIYYPDRRQLINSLTFVLPKTAKKKAELGSRFMQIYIKYFLFHHRCFTAIYF